VPELERRLEISGLAGLKRYTLDIFSCVIAIIHQAGKNS
jgi:hypothetical protein